MIGGLFTLSAIALMAQDGLVAENIKKVEGSVVFLEVSNSSGRIATGTGFVISCDGFVLTADHIVQNPTDTSLRVTAVIGERQGLRLPLYFRGRDKQYDLAIWQLPQSPNCRQSVRLSQKPVSALQRVWALGFPENDGLTTYPLSIVNTTSAHGYYKGNASLRGGDSGGPVVDENGDVVAIVEGGGGPGGSDDDLTPIFSGVALARDFGVRLPVADDGYDLLLECHPAIDVRADSRGIFFALTFPFVSKPSPWGLVEYSVVPNRSLSRSELNVGQPIYRCELTNYGSNTIFDAAISLSVGFDEAIKDKSGALHSTSGTNSIFVNEPIRVAKIDSGKESPFIFYVYNDSHYFVSLRTIESVTYLVGNSDFRKNGHLLPTNVGTLGFMSPFVPQEATESKVDAIVRLISQANAINKEFDEHDDPDVIGTKYAAWYRDAEEVIRARLGSSYLVQFQSAQGNGLVLVGHSIVGNGYWALINGKNAVLNEFLVEMRGRQP